MIDTSDLRSWHRVIAFWQVSEMEDRMVGRRKVSVVREVQIAMTQLQQQAVKIDWTKVFKASFMLLFVSYPGASTEWVVSFTLAAAL